MNGFKNRLKIIRVSLWVGVVRCLLCVLRGLRLVDDDVVGFIEDAKSKANTEDEKQQYDDFAAYVVGNPAKE
jgi:hypothetical protein